MMQKSNIDNTEVLVKVLQDGLTKLIEKEANDCMEMATGQLRERMPELMSTVVLQIWKSASLERFGHELRITVNLKGGDKNEDGN